MTTDVLQENLLRALARAGRLVPTKPQLPVIQNVLLSSNSEGLAVTATNLETTETVRVGAKVETQGGICVSSRLLLDFVSTLPQGTVHLVVSEGALRLQSGGFRAMIPGVAAEEFPPVVTDARDEKTGFSAEKTELEKAINSVVFAAATDEGRPLLTGVKIAKKEGGAVFAATDGYRLSVKKTTLKPKEALDILVPARALFEVMKVSGEEKTVKEIQMTKPTDAQMAFIIGDTDISTRLIDGDYPDFEKRIPTKWNTRVLFEKESLARAVKSASIFARDSANIIRIRIDGGAVTISANTPQVGEDEVDVEAKIEGEGGEIAFNSRFLAEFLSNYFESELVFEMTGSLNPGVFRPAKDDSLVHLIMPVRVSSE